MDGGLLPPPLLGAGKAAPKIEPSLGPCPLFRRDMEKPKAAEMVRARSSTGDVLSWRLE